jgi:hypothetical protein
MGDYDPTKNDLNWLAALTDTSTRSQLSNALSVTGSAKPSASQLNELLAAHAPSNYLAPPLSSALGLFGSSASQGNELNRLLTALEPANHLAARPEPANQGLGGILELLGASQAGQTSPGGYFNSLTGGPIDNTPSAQQPPYRWIYVERRFTKFLANLAYTKAQEADCRTQQGAIIQCLNKAYYGVDSKTDNAILIGSWGKGTRTRPPRDADILYLLPAKTYHQFQARIGNRQSQLLQYVKSTLVTTYSRTEMRGDGQVVVVPFSPPIEIAVGFVCQDGSIIIADTNGGGSYRPSTAAAEAADIDFWDRVFCGNVRALARMMKTWQRVRNVDDLKSFWIERLVIEFLQVWQYNKNDAFWYDWMVRDFLAFLIGRANTFIVMPGTGERVFIGDGWLSRAQTAHRHAVRACDYEKANNEYAAGIEWQDIFGTDIPAWAT